MGSGVPGAPGVDVLRPVEREAKQGLETVILLLQLMEESHVLGIEGSLKAATLILVEVFLFLDRLTNLIISSYQMVNIMNNDAHLTITTIINYTVKISSR